MALVLYSSEHSQEHDIGETQHRRHLLRYSTIHSLIIRPGGLHLCQHGVAICFQLDLPVSPSGAAHLSA